MFLRHICLYGIFLLLLSYPAGAQSFGLGFFGHEVVQDKRTSLDLTPDQSFCFHHNFEISFDLAFLPGYSDYFGYVPRIIRNEKDNIDLVYDKVVTNLGNFKLIVGDKPPSVSFNLDSSHLFKIWNKCRLQFDFDNDRIIFYCGKGQYIQSNAGLKKSDCFRITFGASPYQQFITTDVPPMKIRDIRVLEENELLYYWSLNERTGLVATDSVRGANAAVKNPLWIKNTHYEWKPVRTAIMNGPASVAFDPKSGILYLVGWDSLGIYNLSASSYRTTAYHSGILKLLQGNQSMYDTQHNRLYNLYQDEKLVSTFDFSSGRWDKTYLPADINFWHSNKFYSPFDSALYFLNGYGHLLYKNQVQRYELATGSWETIKPGGDFLTPRYLAAAGINTKGDTAYIIGGYGSSTGQQIVNPRNLYDMVVFDVKRRTFKKLYELDPGKDPFTFANSLVINHKKNCYYGLIFSNEKYNATLQLIKGSLSDASYQLVGDKIPYAFHDIASFADLYFCPANNKFVAVTLLEDTAGGNNHSVVNIYTLDGAPVPEDGIAPVRASGGVVRYIIFILAFILTIIFFRYWFRKKRRGDKRLVGGQMPGRVGYEGGQELNRSVGAVGRTGESPGAGAETGNKAGARPGVVVREPVEHPLRVKEEPPVLADQPIRAVIYLFGDLQVFDKEGNDLTRQFTPLLKELFLLILLHSLKSGRGISSEKLNENLWFDKTEKSARNNRSVNIAKLKSILDKMEGCELSKETGYWKFTIDDSLVRVDYRDYLLIVGNRNTLDKKKLIELGEITKRGSFINNLEYPWLDSFKSEVSNNVIDTYLDFAESGSLDGDPEFLITLADYIFYFDPVNEKAMKMKCKALVSLGKHSLARNTYESFVKEYKTIYGESFGLDFQKCIS